MQVDQRFTRPNEGVGLSLAITLELARGMGGDLTAESQEGRGSKFTVTPRRGGSSPGHVPVGDVQAASSSSGD